MFKGGRVCSLCTGISVARDRLKIVPNKFLLFRDAMLAGNKILVGIKFATKDRGRNIFPLFHVEILKRTNIAEIYIKSVTLFKEKG